MSSVFKFGVTLVIIGAVGCILTNDGIEKYIDGTDVKFDITTKGDTYEIYHSGDYTLNVLPSNSNKSYCEINLHGKVSPTNTAELEKANVFDLKLDTNALIEGIENTTVSLYLGDDIDNIIVYKKGESNGSYVTFNNIDVDNLTSAVSISIKNSVVENYEITSDNASVHISDSKVENINNSENKGYGLNSTSKISLDINNSYLDNIFIDSSWSNIYINNSTVDVLGSTFDSGNISVSNSKIDTFENNSQTECNLRLNNSKFNKFVSNNNQVYFEFNNSTFDTITSENTSGSLNISDSTIDSDGYMNFQACDVYTSNSNFVDVEVDGKVLHRGNADEVLYVKAESGTYNSN